MKCLIEIHYLPCIAYFSHIAKFNEAIIEKNEYYVKQSYRNRCHINTDHGLEKLIIPVSTKQSKTPVSEVLIDHSQKWINNHWRAIESAYRKAPFFEHYANDLNQVLYKKHEFLYDLNFELLTMCLAWLNLPVSLHESKTFEKEPNMGIRDMRGKILAKNYDLTDTNLSALEYHQVFGNSFVRNLSVIDLLFCEGPAARKLVLSAVNHEQNKIS